MSQSPVIKNSHAVRLLTELRARLLNSIMVFFILFAALLYFSNTLYTWLALPLLKFLPQGHLIATQIVSPFFVPFRLAFIASVLLSAPLFLYEIWAFASPALYRHEKKLLWPCLLISVGLFYLGIVFAYFIMFPLLFHFRAGAAPLGVVLSPDISEYLDFTIKLLLIFGMLFEIPIIMILLVATHIVSHARFVRMRPYAIMGAFVVGMLLAPPDVLSQIILAIPICLLFETGIILSRFMNTASGKNSNDQKT